MFCSKCGAQVADTAAFCPTCGQATGAESPAPRGIPLAPGGFAPAGGASVTQAPVPVPAMPAPSYPAAFPAQTTAYAGFWLRFVAAIIDIIILWIPLFFIIVWAIAGSGLLSLIQSGRIARPEEIAGNVGISVAMHLLFALFIGGLVIPWLYFSLFESSTWQGTIGKKALGLYVTDFNGNRVTFGRATGRFFSKVLFEFLPYIGPLLLYPIDCIFAGLTPKKQALHDMIASCLVLRRI